MSSRALGDHLKGPLVTVLLPDTLRPFHSFSTTTLGILRGHLNTMVGVLPSS